MTELGLGVAKKKVTAWVLGFIGPPMLILLGLLFLAVLVGSAGGSAGAFCGDTLPGQANTAGVKIGSTPISTEQASNARIIIDTAKARSLSVRDTKITLMTALQESTLINNPGGDRDSAGLFQQRPSQGWGTYAQVTDPVYATNTFIDRLVKVENRDQMPLMEVAITIQRPSRAAYTSPSHNFNSWEDEANQLLGDSSTTSETASVCAANLSVADGSLGDPGEGPKGSDGLVPRASNLRQFVFNNWGCDKVASGPCIKEIGGYRATPSGPQDHSLGLAVDIVISDNIGAYPDNQQTAFGWGMACLFQEKANDLGIQYAIWQGKIWNVDRNSEGDAGGCTAVGNGWRPYSGSGVTQGHYDHIHVTVQPGP